MSKSKKMGRSRIHIGDTPMPEKPADVAQSAEPDTCNVGVEGSSPSVGSTSERVQEEPEQAKVETKIESIVEETNPEPEIEMEVKRMPEDTKDLDIGDEIETTIGKGTHKAEIMVKTPVMGGDGKPVTIDIGDEIETTIGKGTHKAEIIGVVEVKGKGKHFIVKIDRAQYRVNAKTLTLG